MSEILDHLKKEYLNIHDAVDFDSSYLQNQKLDELYIEIFSRGIDSLFSSIKLYQPLTFQKLKECTGLYLLEYEQSGNKNGNHFEVALAYKNGLITSNFINIRTYKRRTADKIVPSSLEYIPKELRCYYEYCDGLNIPPKNNPAGIMNYILPRSTTTFDSIEEIISEYSLDREFFSYFIKNGSNDFFVWCADPESEYVLIDKSNFEMYIVNYKSEGKFRLLENSVKGIDEYFSQIIQKRCIL